MPSTSLSGMVGVSQPTNTQISISAYQHDKGHLGLIMDLDDLADFLLDDLHCLAGAFRVLADAIDQEIDVKERGWEDTVETSMENTDDHDSRYSICTTDVDSWTDRDDRIAMGMHYDSDDTVSTISIHPGYALTRVGHLSNMPIPIVRSPSPLLDERDVEADWTGKEQREFTLRTLAETARSNNQSFNRFDDGNSHRLNKNTGENVSAQNGLVTMRNDYAHDSVVTTRCWHIFQGVLAEHHIDSTIPSLSLPFEATHAASHKIKQPPTPFKKTTGASKILHKCREIAERSSCFGY